ncbi:MAG: hydroxyacid dehydrogenase, partial [Proteobacteria bacterium]|nr:hydroxyacid dehydrogenase [Pseudomonadota bacterium]
MTAAKPTVLVLAHGELLEQILPDHVRAELESFAAVRYQEVERKLTEDELVEAVPEVEAAITTWGSPRFTARVVAAAPRLKIIAHAAGSVKPYVEPAALEKGIVVVGSAEVIAQ